MNIIFGQSFMRDPARAQERARWRRHFIEGHDRAGILRALKGIYTRKDVRDEIGSISVPVLVMTGEEDVATLPEEGRIVAEAIPGAQFALIPRAGHSASVEEPEAVTEMIEGFLAGLARDGNVSGHAG